MCGRYFKSKFCLTVALIVVIINSIFILSFQFAAEKSTEKSKHTTLKFNFNHTKYDAPGKYFDLSEWHIQVPEQPINHPAIELINGYSSKYFYYDKTDESMVFMCPNFGAMTTTSILVRTELANDNRFRITNNGFYYQNATMMLCNNSKYIIENRSDTSYSIVVSQIHGTSRALPLVIVQWYSHTNEMVAYYKLNNETVDNVKLSTKQKVKMGYMPMGVKFTLSIIVDAGILLVYLNSKQYLSVNAMDYWTFNNYFKIGNYFHHPTKLNMTQYPNWYSEFKVYKLETIHIYPKERSIQKLIFDPIEKKLQFPFYIFQIGFNKCGTRTLFKFFKKHKIPSIHNRNFDGVNVNISLSIQMKNAYIRNQSILGNLYLSYMFYSDFGISSSDANPWYKTLIKQYPNLSKIFILNYRPLNKWLRSRYIHYAPFFSNFIITKESEEKKKKYPHIEDIEIDVLVLNDWIYLWYKYACHIINDFKIYNRDNNMNNNMSVFNKLILFDIENDKIEKLIHFFAKHNFQLDAENYHITGKVDNFKKLPQYADIVETQIKRWNEITKRYPHLHVNYVDGFKNEYQRIINKCYNQTFLQMI